MIFFVVLVSLMLCIGLWWLLIETEGVYLGRRVVIWLYDVYASRYDRIKDYEPEYEFALLAVPIMSAIEPQTSPLVLDVATGTGRLPVALLSHSHFDGYVIGVDLSRKMLQKAAAKLTDFREYVDFVLVPAESLPFDDDSFDVVTCLESLEFMTEPVQVVHELARVLRPGGLLLLTNRVNSRWMPGHTFTEVELRQHLASFSMINIEVEPWQVDYHRVWAIKAGASSLIGRQDLHEILRCPNCGRPFHANWQCSGCDCELPINANGIVDINCVTGNSH